MTGAWAAGNWVVHAAAVTSGEAHAQALPSAPTGVTAACVAPTTSKTIKVSWTAVSHATTYSVYESTTTATGTYSLVAGGVADHLVDERHAGLRDALLVRGDGERREQLGERQVLGHRPEHDQRRQPVLHPAVGPRGGTVPPRGGARGLVVASFRAITPSPSKGSAVHELSRDPVGHRGSGPGRHGRRAAASRTGAGRGLGPQPGQGGGRPRRAAGPRRPRGDRDDRRRRPAGHRGRLRPLQPDLRRSVGGRRHLGIGQERGHPARLVLPAPGGAREVRRDREGRRGDPARHRDQPRGHHRAVPAHDLGPVGLHHPRAGRGVSPTSAPTARRMWCATGCSSARPPRRPAPAS